MVAEAYSPIVLTILGAQMISVKNAELKRGAQTMFWSGLTIQLLLSPLIACLGLYMLGIRGILFNGLMNLNLLHRVVFNRNI